MFNLIAIGLSIVIGALAGRTAANIMNKGKDVAMMMNPVIWIIFGIVGGAIGSWLFGTIVSGGWKIALLQVGAGIVGAVLLILFLSLFRDREEEDEFEEETEEEEAK